MNGRPTTPSRLSQPPDSDDERENTANTGPVWTAVWTAVKRDEMKKKLTNVIEELVRTEKSYLSRIHALKSVSTRHMSRAGACADIQLGLRRQIATLLQGSQPATDTAIRGQSNVCEYRTHCARINGVSE